MQNFLYYIKKYSRDILLFGLLLILLVLIIYLGFFVKEENEKKISNEIGYANIDNDQMEKIEENTNNSKIFVDIKGAIKKPGVYEVDASAIVNDLIKLAGGFNSNAYQDGINLSKKLKNEMVVYIYTKSEISKYQSESNKLNSIDREICTTPDYNICECINDKNGIIEIGEKQNDNKSDSVSNIVNINTASINELITLTGIGESKALAIIKYREDNGNFTKIEDIMNVSGIGEKAFEKIKDLITI